MYFVPVFRIKIQMNSRLTKESMDSATNHTTMMRNLISICAVFLFLPAFSQLNLQLHRDHEKYLESAVLVRRFKHEDVMQITSKLGKEFRVQQVGASAQGRAIRMITYGNGPIHVLMWSQMHGDETTATRAILDIFRFLAADDAYNELRTRIKSGITWHFIPMLNPDGAARFTRRNRDGIDINRDALRLQSPEGRILKRVRDSLRADWGFNLHDQGRGTMVNGKSATISLLAPPYNQQREVNDTRGDAMQMTRFLHDQIATLIPGQIGLYPDDFEPRAFGDNIQKWGTRTILIESGGYGDDWEKKGIRKLNFVLLLTAAGSIADKSYEKIPVIAYEEIPKNSDGRIMELIVKNVKYQGILRDIGIDRREIDSEDFRNFYVRSAISDLGDLSTSTSYLTFDAEGYEVLAGKVYEPALDTWAQFQQLPMEKLMREGYTDFVVKGPIDRFAGTKVNIHQQPPSGFAEVQLGSNPSLIFRQNTTIAFALINGVIYKVN